METNDNEASTVGNRRSAELRGHLLALAAVASIDERFWRNLRCRRSNVPVAARFVRGQSKSNFDLDLELCDVVEFRNRFIYLFIGR